MGSRASRTLANQLDYEEPWAERVDPALGGHSRTPAQPSCAFQLLARSACYRTWGEQPPVPLGDHVDRAVDDLDGGVVVDRVRRTIDLCRPSLGVGHRVPRRALWSQVRADREVDESEGFVATAGRLPLDEVLADTRGHHHASGAQSHPCRLVQRGQEVRQPGLPHPVAEVEGIAAVHQEDICLSDPWHPAFPVEAGQRGEFQDAYGLPPQLGHGAAGLLPADEAPSSTRTGHRVRVRRGGDAEGVGFFDRLPQQVDERVVDARVLDAGGREKELHAASWSRYCRRALRGLYALETGRSPETHRLRADPASPPPGRSVTCFGSPRPPECSSRLQYWWALSGSWSPVLTATVSPFSPARGVERAYGVTAPGAQNERPAEPKEGYAHRDRLPRREGQR